MPFDRYTDLVTSFEIQSIVGSVFHIRSFCDDPTGTTYLTKEPVCKLALTPLVQFINTNIAWDISNSRSATGTIDTFDIDWGGTTDIGDLSAQSWAGAKTGNVQYTTIGTYTVTATVTDTLGNVSTPQELEVRIINLEENVYVATTDSGVFYLTPSGGPTQINTGLSGTHLNVRALRMHPAFKGLVPTQQHIWLATEGGAAVSTDGGANWTVISEATLGTPENAAGDSPAPAATDPDNIDIFFDPQDWKRVYLLRTTTTPNLRAWLYWTDDYGVTWSNEAVGV